LTKVNGLEHICADFAQQFRTGIRPPLAYRNFETPEILRGGEVPRRAGYSSLGDPSPQRRAIRRALESGPSYRQVQIMSKHMDPKTVMRYDRGRENLDQSAVNFLSYGEA
jgi:hypothetical protein